MKKHEKFLEFNGKTIVFLNVDGTYYVALKPILEALNLPASRYLKRTKRDAFFSTCLDTVSMQVSKNGLSQVRNMTCLPEQFIYGWICFLNSDDPELIEYKRTCYTLLYSHFHGTITNRKDLLLERNDVKTQIHELKEDLKQHNDKFKKLRELETEAKGISRKLNTQDEILMSQTSMVFDQPINN